MSADDWMPDAPGRDAVLVHPRKFRTPPPSPDVELDSWEHWFEICRKFCELAIFGEPNTCFWRNASINVLLFSDRYVTCKHALAEHRKKSTPNGSVTGLALHRHLCSSNSSYILLEPHPIGVNCHDMSAQQSEQVVRLQLLQSHGKH